MNWQENDFIKEFDLGTVTREDLQAYANASLDHNPIHLDETFAKAQGLPGVIAHGMLSMAYLAQGLSAQFPDTSFHLKHLKSRFRKMILPGNHLTFGGQIKKITEENALVLNLWIKNESGEIATDGVATVESL